MKRSAPFLLLATLAAFAALPIRADETATIYKGVDAKGMTVYSNSPQGLRNAQKVVLPESPISGTTGYVSPTPPSPTPSASELDSKRQAAQAAEEALDKAIKAKASGEEPLPGERIGTATGGSRLTPSYFARQEALAAAVAKAQADLDAASQ